MSQWTVTKDPQAVKPYTIDWTLDLASGDTVQTATWTADPGITTTNPTISPDGHKTTVFVSSGAASQSYKLVCKIVTAQGMTDLATIVIVIEVQ
jgi:Tol biopolymer transport system component